MTYQYQVSFAQAIKRAFTRYCSFKGRASRSEYWWFYLFYLIVSGLIFTLFGGQGFMSHIRHIIMGNAGTVAEVSGTYYTVNNLWHLIVLLPGLGLFCRRMHDTGHSGWWWLWLLLPVIGWIIVLITLCRRSVPRENEYGPVPNLITRT